MKKYSVLLLTVLALVNSAFARNPCYRDVRPRPRPHHEHFHRSPAGSFVGGLIGGFVGASWYRGTTEVKTYVIERPVNSDPYIVPVQGVTVVNNPVNVITTQTPVTVIDCRTPEPNRQVQTKLVWVPGYYKTTIISGQVFKEWIPGRYERIIE